MSTNSESLLVGVTMGDPAGIGPEITLRAVAHPEIRKACRPVIIGDKEFLKRLVGSVVPGETVVDFERSTDRFDQVIEVFDLGNIPMAIIFGEETAAAGKASAEYIEAAVKLWNNGTISAIATAPISKKAIGIAGYNFPGHTEFLAYLTNTREFAMSFFAEKLCVVLLSTHVSLREAIGLVRTPAMIDLIRFSARELKKLLGRDVKLAVAGLNPHASEGGMFGDEENNEIVPAIERCKNDFGINVSGPYSPDTIFLRGFRGEFDGVIACYHDQATIAVKSLSFGSAVNVTLGLPLIRTSVDHGTAFDIAGKGVADSSSMRSAILLAQHLASIQTSENVS
ncbi:MAG: 4-hydroxythreonine-4-phosphate dehydrogenase PdxA [Pyrinomonadaceae bacterium]